MNQKRNKAFGALGASAAIVILCLGVSCSQTTPTSPSRPGVAPTTGAIKVAPKGKVVGTIPDVLDPVTNQWVPGTTGSAQFWVTPDTSIYPAPTITWQKLAADGVTWNPILENGKPVTGSTYLWIGFTADDSGTQLRAQATNSKGSCFSNPEVLAVGKPAVPPVYGSELIYERFGKSLVFPLSAVADLDLGAYTLGIPVGSKLQFVIAGSASPATSTLNVTLYNSTKAAAMTAATAVSLTTAGTATELAVTTASDAADDLHLQVTGAGTPSLTLTAFDLWLVPTAPAAGDQLLYAFDVSTNPTLGVPASQYGYQWKVESWTIAGQAKPFPWHKGDSLTFILKGTTAFDLPAGEKMCIDLWNNGGTGGNWLIANHDPVSAFPDVAGFGMTILDGGAKGISSGTPFDFTIDAPINTNSADDTAFSDGILAIGGTVKPSTLLLMIADNQANGTSGPDKNLTVNRFQVWINKK